MAFSKYSASIFIVRGARPLGLYYPLAVPPKYDYAYRHAGQEAVMPRGPHSERRPGELNARAVMIAKIARGEIQDFTTDSGKNAAAVALGRMGGKARAAGM